MDQVASLLGLIGSSPNLNKIIIEMDVPCALYPRGRDNPFNSLEPCHLDFWRNNLWIVSVSRIGDHESELDFVKLLLLKSPYLQTMYIETSDYSTLDERMRILTIVNRFRRTSAAAEVEVNYGDYK